MKKVIIGSLLAGLVSLNALEVYKDEKTTLNLNGSIRGYIGYGNSVLDASRASQFMFGVQGNSRVGFSLKSGGFYGNILVGLDEKTLLNGQSNVPGFRWIYAGYDFDGIKFQIGKMDTVSSMSGFSSNIWNTDTGSVGFGGYSVGTRRLGAQLWLPFGLGIGISENDSGKTTRMSQIPRFGLTYVFKNDNVNLKVSATYLNTHYYTHAAAISVGAKYKMSDFYVSGILSYGLNADLIDELQIGTGIDPTKNLHRSTTNMLITSKEISTNIAAALLEFGYNINDSFGLTLGAGYQNANAAKVKSSTQSYGAYFQAPYKINKYVQIIPQIGYYGASIKTNGAAAKRNGGILAFAQTRVSF